MKVEVTQLENRYSLLLFTLDFDPVFVQMGLEITFLKEKFRKSLKLKECLQILKKILNIIMLETKTTVFFCPYMWFFFHLDKV